ncbi:MAG: ATP synthase F1 subunit delta [Bryobacteraceae bacterium]|nr:ATP synthase F1 subunit delta [Bryobacteraceae bacterium]
MSLAIANRYAHALADVVLDPSSGIDARRSAGQLRSVEALVKESPDLRAVLMNPAVTPPRKRAVVSRLVEPLALPPALRNFLFVLIDRRRIGLLDEIRQAFENVLDQRLGVVRADIASAKDLDAGQRAMLTEKLAMLTGSQVRPEYAVDPSLLGGAVVRIGSTIYDGSLRGQMEALRKRLTE